MTVHRRGEGVWYPAVFAEYDRPFLVLSTDAHPFHDEECIGLAVTKTAVPDGVPITEADWEIGTLPEQSYIEPWNPAVLKTEDVQSVAGGLRAQCVDRTTEALIGIRGL